MLDPARTATSDATPAARAIAAIAPNARALDQQVSPQVSAPSASVASTAPGQSSGCSPVVAFLDDSASAITIAPARDRQVDEEDRAPADRVDQPAAERRADRAGDRARRRPGADRPARAPRPRRRCRGCQAVGHQHRRADALHRARGEQQPAGRRQRAGSEASANSSDARRPASAAARNDRPPRRRAAAAPTAAADRR